MKKYIIVLLIVFASMIYSQYKVAPTALKTTAQDLTTSWVDIGGEINITGYRYLHLWINLDINSTNNARFRVLFKRESAGTDEYGYYTKSSSNGVSTITGNGHYYEFGTDADQKIVVDIGLKSGYPYCQVQVSCGTVGATAGQIDSIYYSLGN
jgi:hypothetical protein